jgi:hypothetical protein
LRRYSMEKMLSTGRAAELAAAAQQAGPHTPSLLTSTSPVSHTKYTLNTP